MKPGLFWIASFPKSGNTWVRLVLAGLQAGGGDIDINRLGGIEDAISSSRRHFDILLDIDSSLLTQAEIEAARPHVYRQQAQALHATAFRKTHEACIEVGDGTPLFPPDITEGAIYIVRDPRDVAISLAHHAGVAIDEAIGKMESPGYALSSSRDRLDVQVRQLVSDWSSNVTSWLDRGPCTPLLIRYEEMLADPAESIRRLAAAAGQPAPEAVIDSVVRSTRFQELQQQELDNGFIERPMKAERFFRAGTAGQWRRELTTDQISRIERRHGDVMERLGYL
ncbi:sulfotransferase domain-containing protein [Radicibacter daui]|uniref:sulfotransferase domain-containing protein n=1 Tax=Radicibacter daui TaxID=3064829 RepID=UPI004046F474